MQQTSMTVEIQALMDHSGWVQELAHKLVADSNVADDLAQETMLAALRGGTSPVRSSKAWLGAVLKNLLFCQSSFPVRLTVAFSAEAAHDRTGRRRLQTRVRLPGLESQK